MAAMNERIAPDRPGYVFRQGNKDHWINDIEIDESTDRASSRQLGYEAMRSASSHKGLDDKDVAILRALAEDGRVAFAELGRKIGLSQPAMSERVKRLEDRGVISGYSVRIDWERLGIGLGAVIRLATDHSNVHACMEKLRSTSGVVEILRVTGEDCLFIRVVMRNAKELESVVDSIARFGLVRTSVILSEESYRLAPLESKIAAASAQAACRALSEKTETRRPRK